MQQAFPVVMCRISFYLHEVCLFPFPLPADSVNPLNVMQFKNPASLADKNIQNKRVVVPSSCSMVAHYNPLVTFGFIFVFSLNAILYFAPKAPK